MHDSRDKAGKKASGNGVELGGGGGLFLMKMILMLKINAKQVSINQDEGMKQRPGYSLKLNVMLMIQCKILRQTERFCSEK